MISQQQKDIILTHIESLKPVKAGIFGSYARGDNKVDSDLDILVFLDYTKHRISLLDLIRVELDLSEALGVKVDLVTEKSLSPYIRPYIEKELQYIIK